MSKLKSLRTPAQPPASLVALIVHLYNGTPIDWHCKNQSRVEGATRMVANELQAAKTSVEQTGSLITAPPCITSLSVPLGGVVNGSDASWLFRDAIFLLIRQ